MVQSITRKFLVKELPDISNLNKESYERYYLYNKDSIVIRVQRVNDIFELERKANENDLIREGETIRITQDEFESLKKLAIAHIVRDSYTIQKEDPKIVIRVYHASFEGLIRIEVNFKTMEAAELFKPLDWFGKEITGSPLSQDGYLLNLKDDEFQKLVNE